MFTEDARNYRKGYRDDWKVLKYNKDAYIIQTGDGSEHCLTKMLRWFKPRDDDDDVTKKNQFQTQICMMKNTFIKSRNVC